MGSKILFAVSLLAALTHGSCAPVRRAVTAPDKSAAIPQPRNPKAQDSYPGTTATIDFDSRIKPILQARCQPCHFAGGKMYARLPFDRAQTIRDLGTKLFTRIKDKNEQELIRTFLAQQPAADKKSP